MFRLSLDSPQTFGAVLAAQSLAKVELWRGAVDGGEAKACLGHLSTEIVFYRWFSHYVCCFWTRAGGDQ